MQNENDGVPSGGQQPAGPLFPSLAVPYDRKQRLELMVSVAPTFLAGNFDGEGRQMRASSEIVIDIAEFVGMLMSSETDQIVMGAYANSEEAAKQASQEHLAAQNAVSKMKLDEKEKEAEILKKAFPRD